MVPGLAQIAKEYEAEREEKLAEGRASKAESLRRREEVIAKSNRETAEIAAEKIRQLTGRVVFPGRFSFNRDEDQYGKPAMYPEWIGAEVLFEGRVYFRVVIYNGAQNRGKNQIMVRRRGTSKWIDLGWQEADRSLLGMALTKMGIS